MNILLTGATGFIGSHLLPRLLAQGHTITILSRQPQAASRRFGPALTAISQLDELPPQTRFDAIINLAGAPVVGPRWTASRKQVLLQSREGLTQSLGRWLAQHNLQPKVWINASAIGYYGSRGDEALDEQAAPTQEFMSELCQRWESAARQASGNARLLIFRLGVVLGDGGALPKMLLPFHLRCGCVYGDGRQVLSWVHLDDVLAAIERGLSDDKLQGVYNLTAPQPVSHQQFANIAARQIGGRAWLRLPRWLLHSLMGEAATLFVDGQRVLPKALLDAGFQFRHTTLEQALRAVLKQ